ncbi:MAG: hypothetical protein FD151_787 [bacterium]|nr:MAG: hypothetical protein FD151_787 [bacterium]
MNKYGKCPSIFQNSTKTKEKLGSIENKDWLFAPMKWKGSIVLVVAGTLVNLFTILSLFSWVRYFLARYKKRYSAWIAEAWVILLISLLAFGLIINNEGNVKWWVLICAVYVLIDSMGANIRDVVIAPIHYKDQDGPYISVDNGTRWIIMAFLNVIEVILCFAILFLHYGHQFFPWIEEPMTAIYFSAVTFITVGYGDIKPIYSFTKMLVCGEIFCFIILLVIKLPAAISILRIKEEPTGPKEVEKK